MNSKNKLCYKWKLDDLDDKRIDQLIARYSNIRAPDTASGETKNYSTSRTRIKTKLNASRNTGHSGTLHICPIENDNYIYKFPSLSNSKQNSEEKLYRPIQIKCHNICGYSNSNDADSSLTTSVKKRSKPLFASKSKQVQFQVNYKNVDQQTSSPIFPCSKSCAEKTTYCRPLRNSCDRQFIGKMMEKNAKLQLLLAKYVISRQKEKEKEKWNNYINMLKIKNGFFRNTSRYFSSPSVSRNPVDPSLLNDSDNTKYNLHQSDSCREILHDLYDTSNELFLEYSDGYQDRTRCNNSSLKRVYHSSLHCFPSTSRVKKIHKNRYKPDRTWVLHRGLYSPRIVIEDESSSTKDPNQNRHLSSSATEWVTAEVYQSRANILNMTQNKNAQTNITFGGYDRYDSKLVHFDNQSELELQTTSHDEIELDDNQSDPVMNEVENIVMGNETYDVGVGSGYRSNEVSELPRSKTSIENLENKIDKLTDVLNSFIKNLKSKGTSNELDDSVVIITELDKNQSTEQFSNPKIVKNKKRISVVGNVMTNTSICGLESQLTPSHYFLNMRLNKILHEELHKSNKIRSEIEAMLSPTANRSHAVEIEVEIPTRERSTEVTASLGKTKMKDSICEGLTIEDISHVRTIPRSRPRPDHRIAVNTEPLGLLTLLRLSAEAVKQILSYLPSLSWYLTRLQHPAARSHDYVCNVCGAAFARPSQLHAHILSHDLGQARNCRFCRHTVDSRRSSQLFCCQYCGQRFARAYCCELHQQGCSRRLRTRHSSRALLS